MCLDTQNFCRTGNCGEIDRRDSRRQVVDRTEKVVEHVLSCTRQDQSSVSGVAPRPSSSNWACCESERSLDGSARNRRLNPRQNSRPSSAVVAHTTPAIAEHTHVLALGTSVAVGISRCRCMQDLCTTGRYQSRVFVGLGDRVQQP